MTRPPALAGRPAQPLGGPFAFLALCLITLIPVTGLFFLYRWADDQVPTTNFLPAPTVAEPAIPADPLANPFATVRRLRAPLSIGLDTNIFRIEVASFLGVPDQRSCVAISVNGTDVGTRNPSLGVIPASTVKIVVAAAALDLLGPNYRYTTEVLAAADPADGIVDGDLVLVGGGDPLLSSAWYPTSEWERRPVFNETSLDALADAVVAAGVREITGDVLGDGSRYDDEYFAPGWGAGVAGRDAGPYDALLVNDSWVLGEEKRSADPNAGAAREFTRLLRQRGTTVGGGGMAGAAPDNSVVVASIDSAPMSDVLAEMLTNSDNNTAELLVKELGVKSSGIGTREAGLAAIYDRLAAWGVNRTGIALTDGSGLGLENRMTCVALLNVLQRHRSDDSIGSALAVAGETGGLEDEFADHTLKGLLLGKTGTLSNPPFDQNPPAVKALAGYVPVDDGINVEYVLILNGPTISDPSEYRPVWNKLADVLATYPSESNSTELVLR